MVDCERCGVRMNHTLGDPSGGKFWFECPECGREAYTTKWSGPTFVSRSDRFRIDGPG